jgi:hypothetical protein
MAPLFACLLHFGLVVADPAFISSHYALQEVITFCFVPSQKWLRMQAKDFIREESRR